MSNDDTQDSDSVDLHSIQYTSRTFIDLIDGIPTSTDMMDDATWQVPH